MKPSSHRLAIVGGGASAIYLLRHLCEGIDDLAGHLHSIHIFERSDRVGCGMPYSPETTDRFNLSNISSAELPALPMSFVDWLRAQDDATLADFRIQRDRIDEEEVYSRLSLGAYLHAQYRTLVASLHEAGIRVHEHPATHVTDLLDDPAGGTVTLVTASGESFPCTRVIIATGHVWDEEDRPEHGFYASPWPIRKILPPEGTFLNHEVGTLGASLSAFDVVTSLSHRHGRFTRAEDGTLTYTPLPGSQGFSLSLHSSNGWLPHLQYDQAEPFREIYRHTHRDELLALCDAQGFLPLDAFFDAVCRPALATAFEKDGMDTLLPLLADPGFTLEDFVHHMESLHQYADAFVGMRAELAEAVRSVIDHRPIHWKEVTDDLMYTLNYHAELLDAPDHERFRRTVMPFLMNVIAALPLSSARILLALHEAGILKLVSGHVSIDPDDQPPGATRIEVDDDGELTRIDYPLYILCGGQRALEIDDYPFSSLVESGAVRKARASFRRRLEHPEREDGDVFLEDGIHYRHTGGIDIDASFRVIGRDGRPNPRILDIAFPHTSGVRPYSYGLQACDTTARILVLAWIQEIHHHPTHGDLETVTDLYEDISS